MEGVAIRARIKEQTEREQASVSLLSKQSSNKVKPKISEIKTEYGDASYPDTILKSQGNIINYVTEYYQRQYYEIFTDKNKQAWFLSFIDRCII